MLHFELQKDLITLNVSMGIFFITSKQLASQIDRLCLNELCRRLQQVGTIGSLI